MPATTTLATATLAAPVGASEVLIALDSTAGLYAGVRLWVDGELMKVTGLDISPWVKVRRGEMSAAGPHPLGATVYIGQAHQFYDADPVGIPPAAVLVSPHINVINGRVWFALGDASSAGTFNRYWQEQTTTHTVVPMGFRNTTQDPTSST